MKKYFIDTNILLDFIGNRKPFGVFALKIMSGSVQGKWQLWTSDNAITTTYYIIEKEIGSKEAKIKISRLLEYIEIQAVDKRQLKIALSSPFKDFEDAVQHYCACTIEGITGIVTRNKKDFKNSQLKVYSPEELFIE